MDTQQNSAVCRVAWFATFIAGAITGVMVAACSPRKVAATEQPKISAHIVYRESVRMPANNQVHIHKDTKEGVVCYSLIRSDYSTGSAISCVRSATP